MEKRDVKKREKGKESSRVKTPASAGDLDPGTSPGRRADQAKTPASGAGIPDQVEEKLNPGRRVEETYIQGEKYRWKYTEPDRALLRDLAEKTNLSLSLVQVLYQRGYQTAESIFSHLFVSADIVPDGKLLHGAERAVDRLLLAIEREEKILIFGDYDVDGITSTAIMLSCMLPLGAKINYFLPNRARDGYGFSEKIAKKAAESGYGLVVTVDNGTSAHKAVDAAQSRGVDVIITDHHQQHGDLPNATVLVNPHQKACEYPYKEFAGVGVIFKVMDLLYKRKNLKMPDKAYELLMLGTIADVVPLLHENRYWVQKGLAYINSTKSFAIQTLLKNGNLENKSRIGSKDIGFMVAPQLNALGRLDDPRDGVKFLISSDYDQVRKVGSFLKEINEERKRVDRGIYAEIVARIEKGEIDLETENLIMAASPDWPSGVIGLVAGKLMQNYGRPSILFHVTRDGIVKGSCRSIPAFNMFDALVECEDLLLSFGGHACAAGLSLKQSDVPEFKKRMEEIIARQLTSDDLILSITPESKILLPDITKQLMSDLTQLEPFGNSNDQPLFWVEGVTVLQEPKLLKDAHVKATLFADGVLKPIMFFNRPELYTVLKELVGKEFSVAGYVVTNEWNGRITTELQGVDIAV